METSDKVIIQNIFEGDNLIITPIIGRGDVNRVYQVKQNYNKFIVRLNNADEYQRFQKEAWCLKEASSRGVISPRVIEMGVKNKAVYMILNFIDGGNGKDITKNKEIVWRTIGEYARKINLIITKGFGERMISEGVFDDSWQRHITYNIESLNANDKLLELGTITPKQQAEIKREFVQLKNNNFNFGLIHGDLSLENVIVYDDKITLLDWGSAESSIVPHMEIVDLLQNQISDTDRLFEEFLKGYGMERSDYVAIKPEIKTLTLLQSIDKCRWAFDTQPDKIDEFSQKVKHLIAN